MNEYHNSIFAKCTKQKYKLCKDVPVECMICSNADNSSHIDCIYGQKILSKCDIINITQCQGDRQFNYESSCKFCYQTPAWDHVCTPMISCKRGDSVRLHKVNCTVNENVKCLGSRNFYKKVECNWTSGYRQKVALILSVCLGGFGIDRFYLGQYREGLGKLFSFGGLGIWTLIDNILIYVGYIGPENGSIYI